MAVRGNRLVRTTLFAMAIFVSIPAVAADSLTGLASVIDANTLEIRGMRLSLWGVAAPPSDQLCRNPSGEHYRCGQQAMHALSAFLDHRPVDCVSVDRDRSRRTVAVCTVAGVDLADGRPSATLHGVVFDIFVVWPHKLQAGPEFIML
jgi:endonuclease YncB( thermonuclease family)